MDLLARCWICIRPADSPNQEPIIKFDPEAAERYRRLDGWQVVEYVRATDHQRGAVAPDAKWSARVWVCPDHGPGEPSERKWLTGDGICECGRRMVEYVPATAALRGTVGP